MASLKLTRDVCRICLEHKERINWNVKLKEFCGISYKDCYYKYTQLIEPDSDCYPTTLCSKCANELKNAHLLFEMALESFNIIQNIFKAKEHQMESSRLKTNGFDDITYESFDENSFTDETTQTEMKEASSYSPAYEAAKEAESENNNFTEKEINQVLNKKNFESLKTQLKHNSTDSFKIDHFKSLETLVELNLQLEIHGARLLTSSAKRNTNQPILNKFLHHTPKKKLSKSTRVTKMNQLKNSSRKMSTKLLKSVATIEEQPLLEPSVTYSSKNDQNPSAPSDHCLSVQHFSDGDLQRSSSNDNRIEETRSQQSEKSLLSDLFGNDIDVNTLGGRKNKKPRELLCQYCSLKVNGSHHLRAHEATHLENRKRNVICPKCGIKLYTKEALNEHRKIHDKNRERKHKCEYCGKAFYHGGALNVHKRIHLGLMVKCQLCPKQFYRQTELDKHLPSHSASGLQSSNLSGKKKKYKIQCQYCDKAVLTTAWKGHKAAHLNQPQVKCKICDKDFFSRYSCSSHIRKTHRKERSEIEENMHYYVDCSQRMSHLMMKQQESLLTCVE